MGPQPRTTTSPEPPHAVHDVDARITALAASQHGVVSRAQLIDAGVAAHRIDYRLKQRRLRALYTGVYRTGAVVSPHESAMAALLACGHSAVLSCGTAALLWEFPPRSTRAAPVEISVRGGRPSPPGVRVYRVATLADEDVTERHGMRVTTPARTLFDLAAMLDVRELERVIALAERQGMLQGDELTTLLARHPHHRGIRALRHIVGTNASPQLTRSEAEARFLDLIRSARLPAPETNVVVNGYEVDCLWRNERLIAEIDGFAFHSSRSAFERDRRRDTVLAAAGYHVMRVTWKQLTRDSNAVLVALAQALAIRRGS